MTEDPLLGSEVGKYRLVRLLGKGGMGRVYEGLQPDLGARVAIKVLSEDAADQPELVERFFAEARTVNLIRHESIAGVIDLTRTASGRPVIVMELVEGRTLRDIVRAGAPPLGGLVQVMIEVLSALAAAHGKGVIHRDLKPDNVMVTASGRAKVLDFGIAKLAVNMLGAAPRTKTGSVLGTPPYMSPEQISGSPLDARSDVYTAGVLLYECVTGRVPFEGSDFEVMRAHLERRPTSPRVLRPDLPIALADVILCALAKDRDQRFASAAAMANALHAASAALPASEWRSLGEGGRMFPRSPAPPLQVPREPSPGHSLSGPTRSERPSQPQVEGATRVERPTPQPQVEGATRIERPSQSPTSGERPASRSRPPVQRRWLWIVAPLAAACAGGAVVLGVRALQGSHAPRRSDAPVSDVRPVDARPADAPPAVTATVRQPDALPPDYDVDHFDPVAYIPQARDHARAIFGDAELVSVTFANILATGADDESKIVYVFRSPSRSTGEQPCLVSVTAGMVLYVSALQLPQCTDPVVELTCSYGELWKRAIAGGLLPAGRATFAATHGFMGFQGKRKDGTESFSMIHCDVVNPTGHE